jgi:hypothetical protein
VKAGPKAAAEKMKDMVREFFSPDGIKDALAAAAATAYVLGFFAIVEAALAKLIY